MKQTSKVQGFTLVELIVVITILAILGTIAFISFQGYSKSARDSTRMSDMGTIKSSLELFFVKVSKYPDPTNVQPITYSGGLAWYQGTFGNSTFTNVERLNKLPLDPLTETEYTYSILNTNKEYELAGILESDYISMISSTNAADKVVKAMVTGTYNGLSLKVNLPNISYVLAVPSIITSIDLSIESNRILETIISSKQMVLKNKYNLPNNYKEIGYGTEGEISNLAFEIVKDNIMGNAIIFAGDIKDLTPIILITKLQEAYIGTTVEELNIINEFKDIDTTNIDDAEKVDNYGVNFINNNLGGSAVTRIYNTCDGIPHNTTKSYYSTTSVGFGISCDTVKKDFVCIDGTWTDLVTSANISSYPETSCSVEGALDCNYLSTDYIHGDSLTVYSQNTIAWDASEVCTDSGIEGTVICNNGTNEGDNTYGFFTCVKGTPTNCTADPSHVINGHTYNVIQLNHDVGSTPTVDISENNGTFRYTFNALCNDGSIIGNETGPVIQSCNSGYGISGNTCVDTQAPTITSVTSTEQSCETIRFTINGASDNVGLNTTPYSFDGGITWQTGNYKDFSGTSYTINTNLIKVRDTAGNIYTHSSSVNGTASSCESSPTNLSLTHSSRNKSFTFTWTGGAGNGGSCKLQYFKDGSTWTNISETTYNCDSNLSNQLVTLPLDGWNNVWSSIQVRVIRTSDSLTLGTFSENLTCSTRSGNSSSTPTVDEDCNGSWDNTSSSSITHNGCKGGDTCRSRSYVRNTNGTIKSGGPYNSCATSYKMTASCSTVRTACLYQGGTRNYSATDTITYSSGNGSGCTYSETVTKYN